MKAVVSCEMLSPTLINNYHNDIGVNLISSGFIFSLILHPFVYNDNTSFNFSAALSIQGVAIRNPMRIRNVISTGALESGLFIFHTNDVNIWLFYQTCPAT